MTKPLIQIGDDVREMTDDELVEYKALQQEVEASNAANAQKLAAKQAVLDKLGLTADEAAALFG